MIRDPHKMTLEERTTLLETASVLLRPQAAVSKRERAKARKVREEVCVSLVVDGYKQNEDGAWFLPERSSAIHQPATG